MEQTEIFEIRNGQLIAYHAQLPEVVIPEGVTCIGVGAFRNVASLRRVTLPEGVTEICSRAFNGCYNLKEVHLPESLRYIGSYAFEYCKRLETVNMPRDLLEIGDHAFELTNLSGFRPPRKLRKIGSCAFRALSGLHSLRFPPHLNEIGERAFENCENLADVYFETAVRTIGDYAFGGCEKLSEMHCADSMPDGPFCSPTAFSCTPYQKKTRIRLCGDPHSDPGVSGWMREPDGKVYLENGVEAWIEANSGQIRLNFGTTFNVQFSAQTSPRYYLNYYYYASPERIENGERKLSKELHGGWIPLGLFAEEYVQDFSAHPEKAMDFILSQIRSAGLVPLNEVTPELLLDLSSSAAQNAARLSAHAKIRMIVSEPKYRIAAVLWPTETLYCEVTPYSRNSGAHPVYDHTPVETYQTYYVYPLSGTSFQMRIDDSNPEIVQRDIEIMKLKNMGYL